MSESSESMMEVREDLMVSPVGDSDPTLREAHFLKPLAKPLQVTVSDILSSSVSMLPMFEPKEWPLTINFNGWRYPSKKWIGWVDSLHLRYESVWRKTGIFEAIMSSKCYVKKNQDLAFGVAEKWCPETNTFVFPWGEATITLEDVMILGGFPVLGNPIFSPLESQEMKEVEERLIIARQEPWRSKKGKASTSAFMDLFINSGSDIEHEAFLATWLSMFVFPHKWLVVNNSVFPIAIHLARGNPIALAPAVLASIYKDLGLLKNTILSLTRNPLDLEVTLRSPFYLVQVWVWERFKNLQPQPNLINHEDPLFCKWDMVVALEIDSVRLALDLGMEDFLWRPYVRYADKFRVFFPENALSVLFGSDLEEELVSFVICVRVSELVGIDSSVKQYLPHRVAMQFGMDQDVPGIVPRFNGTKSIAWENYCRPIFDRNMYFPSRLFEADVTTRYVRWWKESILGHEDFAKNVVRGKRSSRSRSHGAHVSKANRSGNDADVSAGFSRKFPSTISVGKSFDHGLGTIKSENVADVTSGFLPKCLKTVPLDNSVLKGNENVNTGVSTSFPPKHVTLSPYFSVNCVSEENNCGGVTNNSVKVATDESKHSSSQCLLASTAYDEDDQKILPLMKPFVKDKIEPSSAAMEKGFEDANGSKESRMSSDRVSLSGMKVESYRSEVKLMDLEQRISRLEIVIKKLKIARFGLS